MTSVYEVLKGRAYQAAVLAEKERDKADNALREISILLGGQDEWPDQDAMIWDVIERVKALTVGANVGAETVTLEEIIAACDRHPLAVGFVHGDPSRNELQERLDTIKAIAMQAVGAKVGAGDNGAGNSADTSVI